MADIGSTDRIKDRNATTGQKALNGRHIAYEHPRISLHMFTYNLDNSDTFKIIMRTIM